MLTTNVSPTAGGDKLLVNAADVIDMRTGSKILANGTQAGPTTTLTDSTGGTAGSTLAAITAGASYAQADMTAVKNAIASLAAKVNALTTLLQGIGATS